MYFPTNHDFMLKYTHFSQICINPKTRYRVLKEPLYHMKNDKHNLTKKSNFAHLDFEKSNLSYSLKLYLLYENLCVNLQKKASKIHDNINKNNVYFRCFFSRKKKNKKSIDIYI